MTQRHFRQISNSSKKKNPLFGEENVSCRLFVILKLKCFCFFSSQRILGISAFKKNKQTNLFLKKSSYAGKKSIIYIKCVINFDFCAFFSHNTL